MYMCPVHHHVVTKHAMSQSIPCRPAYIEYGTLKTPNPFRKEYRGLPYDFDGSYSFRHQSWEVALGDLENAIRDTKRK